MIISLWLIIKWKKKTSGLKYYLFNDITIIIKSFYKINQLKDTINYNIIVEKKNSCSKKLIKISVNIHKI